LPLPRSRDACTRASVARASVERRDVHASSIRSTDRSVGGTTYFEIGPDH
jgi:hypothetical protein